MEISSEGTRTSIRMLQSSASLIAFSFAILTGSARHPFTQSTAPLKRGDKVVAIDVVSQRVSLDVTEDGRFRDKPVLCRTVRYRVRNLGSKRALVVRTKTPVQISMEGDRFSEGFRFPRVLAQQECIACETQEIAPNEEGLFESTYPNCRAFTTQFAIAYEPHESDDIDWINRSLSDPLSLDEINRITSRTEPIDVKVSPIRSIPCIGPDITVLKCEPTGFEPKSEGALRIPKRLRVTMKVENPTDENMVFFHTTAIACQGTPPCRTITQSLSWPESLKFKRLPIATATIIPAKTSITRSWDYGKQGDFITDFGYALSPTEEDMRIWRKTDSTNAYADHLHWIQTKLDVVRVPIYDPGTAAQQE